MNTKNLKRVVLGGVLMVGFVIALILSVAVQEKFGSNCSIHLNEKRELVNFNDGRGPVSVFVEGEKNIDWCGSLLLSVPPLLIILLLSLITYWAKDELFRAWFNFARWWVPVIIGVTVLLENEGGGGGFGGGLALFFLGSFYLILILGSLSAILHTHFTLKYKEQGKPTTSVDKVKNIFNVFLYGSVGVFFLWLFM